jgi:ligand-binding SRPBCC domain-containing protein
MKHVFTARIVLRRAPEAVFPFFSDAGNLQRITPPELRFRILTPLPLEMRVGALIDYELRLFGAPFRWRTEITHWDPPHAFTDVQLRGPYREWVHTHRLRTVPGGTEIEDEVRYRLPLEPVGDLAYPIVRFQLARIFSYRQRRIAEMLGGGSSAGRGPVAGPGPAASR